MEDYRRRIVERLEKRERKVIRRIAKLKELALANKLGDEANRLWLDEEVSDLAVGLDVCCGDLAVENAIGADKDPQVLADLYIYAESLPNVESGSLDFVVSNYFEAFPNALKVLNEWYRCLKPGGKVALVCRDGDAYDFGTKGLLKNANRVNAYTRRTLSFYLARAGFSDIESFDGVSLKGSFRIVGYKPCD